LIAKTTHKRYANYEQYIGVCADGSSTAVFILDEKDEQLRMKELQKFMQLSGAVKMFKIWTARGGKCKEEVIL